MMRFKTILIALVMSAYSVSAANLEKEQDKIFICGSIKNDILTLSSKPEYLLDFLQIYIEKETNLQYVNKREWLNDTLYGQRKQFVKVANNVYEEKELRIKLYENRRELIKEAVKEWKENLGMNFFQEKTVRRDIILENK